MRLFVLFAALAVLVTAVAGWTKEDHEIFDLVSALEAAEGKGTTFYSWLEIPSSATTPEISRAYRKKSIQLHPDKNRGVKHAHERFSRLGVVAKILRDPEGRKRYDFFYKNGVPVWRGSGYYYSRFRPGLGTTVAFLILVTSGLQYVIHRYNHKRDLARIELIAGQARSNAWGNSLTPGQGQRKVKVSLGGPQRIDEDGNLIPGRMVDMVVEGSNVFMVDDDGSLIPVDSSMAVAPAVKRTWFVALVLIAYHKITGGKFENAETIDRDGEDIDDSEMDDGSGTSTDGPASGTTTPKGGASANGSLKSGKVATSMAGGRRRKTVRKK